MAIIGCTNLEEVEDGFPSFSYIFGPVDLGPN
jgi:hypothetical protein